MISRVLLLALSVRSFRDHTFSDSLPFLCARHFVNRRSTAKTDLSILRRSHKTFHQREVSILRKAWDAWVNTNVHLLICLSIRGSTQWEEFGNRNLDFEIKCDQISVYDKHNFFNWKSRHGFWDKDVWQPIPFWELRSAVHHKAAYPILGRLEFCEISSNLVKQ
jgi:hypothetical protein